MKIAAALAIAAGVAPGAVEALTAKACLVKTERDGVETEYRAPSDLGAGMVAQEYFFSAGMQDGTALQVTHCNSGQGFIVTLGSGTEEGTYRIGFDAEAEVRRMIVAPQAFTLAQMRAALEARGAVTTPTRSNREACGCAVFYPNDIRTKVPWRP